MIPCAGFCMSLKKAIKKYIEAISIRVAPITCTRYTSWLELFYKCVKKDIEDITYGDIVKYQHSLTNRARATQFSYMIPVISLLKFHGRVDLSGRIMLPKFVHENPVLEATPRHIRQLVKVIDNGTYFLRLRNKLIIELCSKTGIRISELLNLQVDDFKKTERGLRIKSSKSYLRRYIRWTAKVNRLLQRYIELRRPLAHCESLLINTSGNAITARQVQRIFRELKDRAGIKEKITPHSLRVGFISDSVRKK